MADSNVEEQERGKAIPWTAAVLLVWAFIWATAVHAAATAAAHGAAVNGAIGP